jgi:hypothetical protein
MRIVRHLLLGLGMLGLSFSLFLPSVCLLWMPCTINAGSQLGAGISGVIAGGCLVFLAVRRRAGGAKSH